jgi:energy-converting hydrogenase Eha subunit B
MAQTGEYHHGEMSVADQRSTYTLFNAMLHWCGAGIAALVAFLTIWLCAHAGFITGAVVAVVIMAVAFLAARKPGH